MLAYLTLFCLALVANRIAWAHWELAPPIALLATLILCGSFGAAIGSLFARPGVGAAVGIVLYFLAGCVFSLFFVERVR
jgi:hypothetical protein